MKTGGYAKGTPKLPLLSSHLMKEIYKRLSLNPKVLSPKTLREGIRVEWEHNDPKANVSHGSLLVCAKIALAHIREFPDYYVRLHNMEIEGDKYWKGKKKESVFLKK